jgi:hypothetical protein
MTYVVLLLASVLLVVWCLTAFGAIAACAAARRGDRELNVGPPGMLRSVDGATFRRTAAS